MKKSWILVVVIVVVVLIGVFFYLNTALVSHDEELEKEVVYDSSEMSEYFQDRLTTLGVLDVGQPIEGFDAPLLRKAFPGFHGEDFDSVETVGGHIEAESGTLTYVDGADSRHSSADRAVTDYAGLLDNLLDRLDTKIESREDVDALIATLDTAQHIRTKIDQGAMALGIKIVPKAVLSDSRCPVNVQCIQAGTVKVSVMVMSGTTTMNHIFVLGQHEIINGKAVTLQTVLPVSSSGKIIRPNEYQFIFWIQKGLTEK